MAIRILAMFKLLHSNSQASDLAIRVVAYKLVIYRIKEFPFSF